MDVLIARLVALLMALAVTTEAQTIRIVSIEPAATDSLLVCHLDTQGLPDQPSTSTLTSGLPSALSVAFTLLNAAGKEIAESRVEIRIEPDLWERRFLLRTPLWDTPLATLGEVRTALSRVGPLPVAHLDGLDAAPHRLRARLAVHPIARQEVERVQSLFSESGSGDRREVSIGIGSLVRFFLGRRSDEKWVSDVTSSPFRPDALAVHEEE